MALKSRDDEDVNGPLENEDTISMAVVTAVADATGQSPLEMDPLWESIDTDALETLLSDTDRTGLSLTVSFTYCGCTVTVTDDDIQVDRSD